MPSRGGDAAELERAVRLTTQWAERQVDAPRAAGQLRFGISQGATDDELRRRSIAEITALGFDGYALGGLAVGESVDEMLECVGWAAPLLPADSPRYFMGIGDPRGILEVVARGIDLFDCVLPTRTARTGSRSPGRGGSTSRTRVHRTDPRPARRGVRVPGVRALLARVPAPPRHAGEILGLRLLSLHNLRFVLDLTARARAAIERGTFSTFRDDALARLAGPPEEEPCAVLIILALVLGVMYVVMIRPQRQRQTQQQRTLENAGVGDDIVTTGGIYATITRVDGDDVAVEIAKGVEVHMTRRGIAAVLPPEDEEEDEEPSEDGDEEAVTDGEEAVRSAADEALSQDGHR